MSGEEGVLFTRSGDYESEVLIGDGQVSHTVTNGDVEFDSSDYNKSPEDEGDALHPPGVDVYEYDAALRHIGFGPMHILVLFGTGLALASDSIEVLAVSYILEELKLELDMTKIQRVFLSCIIFFGMMVGGYVWGSLSDVSGRRRALLMSLTLNGASGVLSGLYRNYYYFLFFRFVSGVGVGGSLPIVASYCAEFIDSKKRAKFLGALASFWIFGQIFSAGLAWTIIPHVPNSWDFLHSWQVFTIVAALPSLLAACIYLLLPESPKFLHQAGKHSKALSNLHRVHRINRKLMCKRREICDVTAIKVNKSSEDDLVFPSIMTSGKCSFLPKKVKSILWRTFTLFKLTYLRRTLLLVSVYFCLSFGSYGITVWFPTYIEGFHNTTTAPNSSNTEDKSRLYTEAFIYAAASIPGTIITAIVVDLPYMTRSIWLCVCLGLSALALFFLLIPPSVISISVEAFNVIMLSLFNGISNGCWNTMSLLTPEIFPTHLRTTASAMGLVFVRIGAILGLILFGWFVEVSPIVPILIVACVMTVGAILSIFLPKTTKRTRLE